MTLKQLIFLIILALKETNGRAATKGNEQGKSLRIGSLHASEPAGKVGIQRKPWPETRPGIAVYPGNLHSSWISRKLKPNNEE